MEWVNGCGSGLIGVTSNQISYNPQVEHLGECYFHLGNVTTLYIIYSARLHMIVFGYIQVLSYITKHCHIAQLMRPDIGQNASCIVGDFV